MSRREGRADRRRFATILFTDIVGSTDVARELGDARWRELIRRHHGIVRRELKRFGGHELDTAGDGFFAIFESAGAAIRCAVAVCDGVREIGLEVRAGLHAGEVEPSEGKAGGIAVNIAARVMSVAGFGEVLVSQTLRDVVAGSTLGFEDHGVHTLKGIDGEWRLSRVASVDGERVAEPLDGAEAARRRLAIEPAPAPTSRRAWAIGAVVAAIAIVAAVAFVVARRDVATPAARTRSTVGPPASSLVKLDPATGDVRFVRRDVPGLAYGGSRVLSAAGSVWLIRPPLVLKVDPQDGSSLPVAGLESGSANELGVGLGRVWAIGYELWPIDPAAGRAGAPIDYGQQGAAFFNGSGVVAAFDRVWVSTTAHAVVEVDPRTRETRSIDVGETPGAIAAGAASVWVLDETANAVSRIDPSSGRALDPIPLTGRQDALAIGEGFVWVLDGRVGTLTPIDEASGEVRSPVDVGAGASSVAVGGGSIWVANGGDVLEIDPASFGVSRTIHVGERPIASLAVGEDGALWLDMAKES